MRSDHAPVLHCMMLCCHAYAFEVERVPNLCSEYRKPIRHLVIDEWAEPASKQTNLLNNRK